jgi:hypothetical protein
VIKLSLVILAVLTVLIATGLRWREARIPAVRAARPAGWVATQKRALNRWVTAATAASLATILLLGGLHWLKVVQQ